MLVDGPLLPGSLAMTLPQPNRTEGIPWERWRAEYLALGSDAPRALDPSRFEDLNAWEKQLRARTFDLLSEPERPREIAIRVVSQTPCDGYTRREVEYATTGSIRVRSWVLLPSGASAQVRVPGLLALHDCGGLNLFGRAKICEVPDPPNILRRHWERCYEGRPFAQELARRGYAVILPDMFGYGDRRLHSERTLSLERSGKPFDEIAEELNDLHGEVRAGAAHNLLLAAGRSVAGMVIGDDISAVNALCAQPEVDPTRLGCLGLSCGGWRTVMLAALDTRVRCSVPVGWMSTLLPIVERRPTGSLGPDLVVSALVKDADYPHLAALSAPRPMLSIQGREDKHFQPAAVESAWEIVRNVYQRHKAEDCFMSSFYDAPHCFNRAMQAEAYAWLDRWLKFESRPQSGLLLALVLFLLNAGVFATDYHVDAAKGSDENDGSTEHPWKTMAKGADALRAGDTLMVSQGTYTLANLAMKHSGRAGAPITVRGTDGPLPLVEGGGAGNGFLLGDVSYITIERLEFSGYKSQPINARANSPEGGNHIALRHCIAHGGEIFIKSNSTKFRAHHILVEGCTLFEMSDIPIFIDNLDHVVVRRNAIFNSKSVCMDPGGVSNLVVERNFVVNPQKLGSLKIRWGNVESVKGPNCNGAIVRNNIFLEGGRYQVLLASANGAMVYNNVLANIGHTPCESGLLFIQRDAVDAEAGKPLGPNRRNVIKNNIFYLNGGDDLPNTWTFNALVCLDKTMEQDHEFQEFDHNLYFKTSGSNYIYTMRTFVSKNGLKGWGKGYDVHSLSGTDPQFAAPDPLKGPEGFQVKPGSPSIDAGGALTTAIGDGRGAEIKVTDARFFADGGGMIEGDRVRIGEHPAVRVTKRDLQTNTLTLEKEVVWKDGAPVSLDYAGKAPDIGAFEANMELRIGDAPASSRVLKRLMEPAGK